MKVNGWPPVKGMSTVPILLAVIGEALGLSFPCCARARKPRSYDPTWLKCPLTSWKQIRGCVFFAYHRQRCLFSHRVFRGEFAAYHSQTQRLLFPHLYTRVFLPHMVSRGVFAAYRILRSNKIPDPNQKWHLGFGSSWFWVILIQESGNLCGTWLKINIEMAKHIFPLLQLEFLELFFSFSFYRNILSKLYYKNWINYWFKLNLWTVPDILLACTGCSVCLVILLVAISISFPASDEIWT